VNAELRRLDDEATKSLKDLEASLSASPDKTTDSKHPSPQWHMPDQSQSKGGADHKAKADGDKIRDLSRESVQKEIETLKVKLKQRQLKEDVVKDEGVNKAREDVVSCLKTNDRRPLDCWREVEAFRREVGRLEGAFLGRVLK
jgi:altered-inheritance-of-mitochondria protein 13